jgi:hypothetical protein
MLLDRDHHAMLFTECRALLEVGGHPRKRLVKAMPCGTLPAREHADDGRAQLVCDHNPILHHLHVIAPRDGVGYGEIVAHACAVDRYAIDEGRSLQLIDIVVRRNFGLTGEIISGGIQRVHIVLRAELNGIRERHAAVA